MLGVACTLTGKTQRFSLQCSGLALESSFSAGLRISVTRLSGRACDSDSQQKNRTRVLPLSASSGPFFIYSDTEEPRKDHSVDCRLRVVGFQHHKKMDQAQDRRRVDKLM